MATPSSDRFPSPPRTAQSEPRKMQCKRRKGERDRVVRVHVGESLQQSLRACAKKEPLRPGCPHARHRRAAAAATGMCGRGCRRAAAHRDEPLRVRHTPRAGRNGDGCVTPRRPTRRQTAGLRPSWGGCDGTAMVGKWLLLMWQRGKGSGKWYKRPSKT
jgi:hypothetical protein